MKCRTCNRKIGYFEQIRGDGTIESTGDCPECTEKKRKAEDAQRAEELQAERDRRIQEATDRVRKIRAELIDSIRMRVSSGGDVVVYDSVYLPVDSVLDRVHMHERFDLSPLILKGFDGWETVAVVPRTVGVALKNTIAGAIGAPESFAGGIGGTVAGVYVILCKRFRTQMPEDECLESCFEAMGLSVETESTPSSTA